MIQYITRDGGIYALRGEITNMRGEKHFQVEELVNGTFGLEKTGRVSTVSDIGDFFELDYGGGMSNPTLKTKKI